MRLSSSKDYLSLVPCMVKRAFISLLLFPFIQLQYCIISYKFHSSNNTPVMNNQYLNYF